MIERKWNFGPALVTMLLVMLAAIQVDGCGTSVDIPSSWTNNQASIDDSLGTWYAQLNPIKDTPLSLGIQNDTGYVYICLVAPEEQFRRQMMAPGLTLWIESDNGRKIGIHYPMGFAHLQSQQSLNDLEILGPGKHDRNLFSTVELPGIKVKIGKVGNQSVYELKVPLHESSGHPYAADVSAGSTLRLEIESGKFEPRRAEGMSEGGETGGSGSGGGRGGGFAGGGRRGGERRSGGSFGGGERSGPIDVTVKVQLASAGINAHQ